MEREDVIPFWKFWTVNLRHFCRDFFFCHSVCSPSSRTWSLLNGQNLSPMASMSFLDMGAKSWPKYGISLRSVPALGPTARLQITLRWIVQLLWVNVRLYLAFKISGYIWRGPAISWKNGWFWDLNFPPLTVIGQFNLLVCAIWGFTRFLIFS